MENLTIYNLGRAVPEQALKPITAGRLKGMSDINPMWRIKKLTEIFGACGLGWWYEITDKRLEMGKDNEIRAFVDIALYYEYEGKTSHPVYGTGGSSFVTTEKNGAYVSDECFKMALTDAISVAAKALGIGADVYFAKDRTKYDASVTEDKPKATQKSVEYLTQFPETRIIHKCADCGEEIQDAMFKGVPYPAKTTIENSEKLFGVKLCLKCCAKRNANK